MTLSAVLVLGFLLGLRHALDADHLAAVATLATRSRSIAQTVWQGVAWGTGHTLTLMIFGGAVLLAEVAVPETAARALEFVVGVMLIVLGADALYQLRRDRVHFHSHRHTDGEVHIHAHAHREEGAPHDSERHEHVHRFPVRALLIGMVHGLAGSAALVLLSLEAMRSPNWGLLYIAVFGAGSILGMAALSAAIAVPLRLSSRRLNWTHYGLSAAIGTATILLGFYIVLDIGLGDSGNLL